MISRIIINQVYRQRGKRRHVAKIIGYKWRYSINGERIRITSSGDMLIGLADTSPHSKLHINGAINAFNSNVTMGDISI